jgi:hypothetical protein
MNLPGNLVGTTATAGHKEIKSGTNTNFIILIIRLLLQS